MRRRDRAVPESEAKSILRQADYGVLSTASADAGPYGVPLHFCVIGSYIYFHCAVEGKKLVNIEQNSRVSFCVVGNVEVMPDRFATLYESVIVSGHAEEVFGAEKQMALEGLLRKYSTDFLDKGLKYIEDVRDKTRVFRISISKLTGKARRR